MFLLIPFIIVLGSFCGIFIIVWRKRAYIRKLDAIEFGDGVSFWVSMFPELKSGFHKINSAKYKEHFLSETEKLLRRLKIVSLKIENAASRWLERFPKSNSHANSSGQEVSEKTEESGKETHLNGQAYFNGSAWKQREQELIIEIAKSPKNGDLYKELGNLYFGQKQWEDAKEALRAAFNLMPEDLEIKARLDKILRRFSPEV
jgi:tetratricopeptide (TPR) repeat protein